MAELLAYLAGLAATVTVSVNVIRLLIDKSGKLPSVTWPIVSLAVGVAYCVGWQLNATSAAFSLIPALAENASRLTGVSGQVLTGLVVGASAGFWHEAFDALRGVSGKGNLIPTSK
jgi:hypothetical protein